MVYLAEGEVTSRLARHEDFNDVMGLNKYVFAGNDYLHVCYHDLIRDPRAHCFVGLLDGKVIAFNCAFMDGPKQYVGVGARVHTDYLRTAVYQTFNKMTADHTMKMHPHLEKKVWVAFDTDKYRDNAKMQQRNITIMERWHTPYWKVPRSSVTHLLENPPQLPSVPLPIQDLPQEEAIKVLTSQYTQQRLFQNNHIVGYYNWLPQLLTPYNIKRAVISHRFRFSMHDNGEVAAVSFSVPHKVPDGTACCTHYNHYNADTSTFIAHLLDHLTHGVQTIPTGGVMVVSLRAPLDIDMDKVKDMLLPYLGKCRSDNNFRLGTGIMAGAPIQSSKL